MRLLAITIALLSITSMIHAASTKYDCLNKKPWIEFKKKNDQVKQFGLEKENQACLNYMKNMETLSKMRKQRKTLPYTVGETSMIFANHSCDSMEGKGLKIADIQRQKRKIKYFYEPEMDISEIPTRFNWVEDKGFTTNVQSQGLCGSCYSFSAAGAIEGQLFKCKDQLMEVSEQYILDCSPNTGGCGGGDPMRNADFATTTGIPPFDEYEYLLGNCDEKEWERAEQGNPPPDCQSPKTCSLSSGRKVKVDSVELIKDNNMEHLLIAIYEVGPIPIILNCKASFFDYTGGVFDAEDCDPNSPNHAVLAVGYDEKSIIIKNSWGTNWGDGGYMRIARTNSQGHPAGPAGILTYSQVVRINDCKKTKDVKDKEGTQRPVQPTGRPVQPTEQPSGGQRCFKCYNYGRDSDCGLDAKVENTVSCPLPHSCIAYSPGQGDQTYHGCSNEHFYIKNMDLSPYCNTRSYRKLLLNDEPFFFCQGDMCNKQK